MSTHEQMLDSLGRPECYPSRPDSVRIVQTSLSIVCLAGDRVYKIKKPVSFPFVDFSTLELRGHFCREELRLNRRLCPEVYLDVAPLYFGEDGHSFVGGGEIVDHAVVMKRLPEDRMMHHALDAGSVSDEEIGQLARRIAEFHQDAARGEGIDEAGRPEKLRDLALDNFRETTDMAGGIFPEGLHVALRRLTEADFERIRPTLEDRREAGHIVEGHGDLHCRNICLTDPPSIFDCIEFSKPLRCEDTATENAFLVMDLIYRGHRRMARHYERNYVEFSGDSDQTRILPPLVGYRAMVRAKVAALRSLDSSLDEKDRRASRQSARAHMLLAAGLGIESAGPVMIVACGLPASGKSSVFEELARRTQWPHISTDHIRKELAGIAPGKTGPEELYQPEFVHRTYAEVLRRAESHLRSGPVLVDGTFSSQAMRAVAGNIADQRGASICLVHFDLGEEQTLRRLADRARQHDSVSDADVRVYRKLKAKFEVPDDSEDLPIIRVVGDQPIWKAAGTVLEGVLEAR